MKTVSSWRQSERKKMIETIEDLIQESHKHAKSQYTPSVQRPRWTRLAGQLIWYKDQILKNTSLEAMEIDMQELKKKVIESIELNKRRSLARNYPTIIVPKPDASKPKDAGS
jgi:hypothetical protein